MSDDEPDEEDTYYITLYHVIWDVMTHVQQFLHGYDKQKHCSVDNSHMSHTNERLHPS